MEDEKIKQEF